MYDLDKLLEFVKLAIKFQQIKRALYATGENRDENDAEHSFQLALIAWYIISFNKLNLDINKVLKYAIVHDLVEVYAGDTPAYTKDIKLKENKAERERKARIEINRKFVEFVELHQFIAEYEKKHDEESKFVYALDKILPALNICWDNGRTWKERNITIDAVKKKNTSKVKASKDVEKYWQKIVKLLEKNKKKLFRV